MGDDGFKVVNRSPEHGTCLYSGSIGGRIGTVI